MLKSYKVIALFLICILPFLPAHATASKASETNSKIKNILDTYRGNTSELKDAYNLLMPLLKNNPKDAMAYVNLSRLICKAGYIMYREYKPGSLEKAQEALDQAIALDSELFDAYYHGVYLYIRSNNIHKAKQFALKAQEMDPDSPKTDLIFSAIALEEDNLDEVIRRSKSALTKSNDKSIIHDSYFDLSKAYKQRKEYKQVDAIYKQMIELYPNDPWELDSYANFLYHRGNYDKAIEFGEKALSIMDFGMARKHLGKAYYQKAVKQLWEYKHYEASLNNFLLAVKYRPTAKGYYGLGISYWHCGQNNRQVALLKKAEAALIQSVELDPEHQQAIKQLKNLQEQLSKYGN